jgi:hypothetical protein
MIEDYQTVPVTIIYGPGRDQWGEPTGAGGRVKVMATYKSSSRLVKTQTGEEVTAAGVFGLAPGIAISEADRILHAGRECRPVLINRPRSLDGEESTRVFVV